MTPEEQALFKAVHADMQIGYAIMDRDRDKRIRETVTLTAIASLRSAFRMAAVMPPRPSSGLIQYYEALKKTR